MSLRPLDERPWLLLCEGEGDKRFFEQLISFRGIRNDFQIFFPGRTPADKVGGRAKFGAFLANLWQFDERFRKNIKGVLVVSDNDESEQTSLNEVRKALADANGFPVPDRAKAVARTEGFPPLVVYMLPDGSAGSLESICEIAALHKWPHLVAPLNAYVAGTPVNGWSPGKRGKMRMQTIIASSCMPRPETGFLGHWFEAQDYHIPLEDRVFDPIEKFLRDFEALIAYQPPERI